MIWACAEWDLVTMTPLKVILEINFWGYLREILYEEVWVEGRRRNTSAAMIHLWKENIRICHYIPRATPLLRAQRKLSIYYARVKIIIDSDLDGIDRGDNPFVAN